MKTRTKDVPHNGHNEFFRVDVNVYQWQGQVMPGQFAFPFTFHLPAGLPGCFSATSSQQATASIRYRIESECDVRGFFNFDIKHWQDMVVQQKLRAPIMNTKREAHEQITKCCCINKGSADLKAHLDKNAYVAGETAQVICEIENQSEINFKTCKVELVRVLTLRSNSGRRHYNKDVVARQDYPGIGPGEVRSADSALSIPLQLGVSNSLSPTVYSRLIDCEYYVEVVFVSDSIMVSNLDIRVNVTIYPPQPPAEQFIMQMPPGFNPQVMGAPIAVQIPQPGQGMMPPTGAPPPQQYPQQAQPQYNDRTPLVNSQPQQSYAPQY